MDSDYCILCVSSLILILNITISSCYELYEGHRPCPFAGKDGREAYGCDDEEIMFGTRRFEGTGQHKMISQGGGNETERPPVFIPRSQIYVISSFFRPKSPTEYWASEQGPSQPENKNCHLCELVDSGACNSMPSCVFCEERVTAKCERSIPCLRCSVIKNPFFRCKPGEKYMDECDSCRCVDGHSGWCTNMHCEFRPLHIYAMKLSDGEFY